MKRWLSAVIVAVTLTPILFGGEAFSSGSSSSPNSFDQSVLLAQNPPESTPRDSPVVEAPSVNAPGAPSQEPTYQPVPDWRTLFPAPVWAMLLGVLSTLLTVPLTGLLKTIFNSEGITTFVVNAALNTFFSGLLPWLIGVYPPTFDALRFVVLSTLIGMAMDKLQHFSIKQTAVNAVG
jgi:hypothetical protein